MKSYSCSILLAWKLSGFTKSSYLIVFLIKVLKGYIKMLPLDMLDLEDFYFLTLKEPLFLLKANELFLDGSISSDLSSLTSLMMSLSTRLLLDSRSLRPRLYKYLFSAQIVAHFSI